MGGGIAVQNRMAFQKGEYCPSATAGSKAKRTPPIRRMLEMGIPVGAGTDATSQSLQLQPLSLPLLAHHHGPKTVGGLSLYTEENPDSIEGSAKNSTRWEAVGFHQRKTEKRERSRRDNWRTSPFFRRTTFPSPEEEIKQLESVLTVVGGKVVHATAEFSSLAPPAPVSPDWSPVKGYGGYARRVQKQSLGGFPFCTVFTCSRWYRAKRAGTSRCWVGLGYGSWGAIVSPFD